MIDFEQELYNSFGQVKDFTLGMRIAKYFYELGSSEKPNNHLEGLDEAAEKWCKENGKGFVLRDKSAYYIGETLPAFKAGAEWQREQMMKEAVNERWDELQTNFREINEAFEAGKKEQKEQMLKEAVEGRIYKDEYAEQAPFYYVSSELFNLPPNMMNGDKVYIVVLKDSEDESK